jgi:vancomycin resistance protein YoaR
MSRQQRIIIIIGGSAAVLLIAFLAVNYLIWRTTYSNLIYPDIKLGDLALGGRPLATAQQLIQDRAQNLENQGLKFQYKNKLETLPSSVVAFDADLSYQSFSFDAAATAQAAFGTAAGRTFWTYLLTRWHLQTPRVVRAVYNLDAEKITEFLNNNFPELDIEPANAYFSLAGNQRTSWKLQENPEQVGKEINYPAVFMELQNDLATLQGQTIAITTHSKYPTIRQTNLSGLEGQAQQIVNRGNLVLQLVATSTKYWEVGPEQIITWANARTTNQQTVLVLDTELIQQYLKTYIAPQVDQAAVTPRFAVVDGRVTNWQNGQDGYQIDLAATAAQIAQNFMSGQNQIPLITTTIVGDNAIEANNLNIKEVIGSGSSNFTGSPANRRHNIAVGAAALQGLLIKPNEEFSLIKALGEIDDKTGYLQELVIKDNKTTPEYGGGLCQIGTTVFRTALATGLPITMRQNHSYRVSYYEPAGTDATIYDPLPDLRFINDTGNYILIQSHIVKNTLYFDFWGTSDGRVATTTAPVIYNIVKPEPTKTIFTTDLQPGQKKCTESSHNGADAYFDYTVIYPAGATTTPVHERRFKSHYVPWQAVCLIGATATSSPAMATSTLNNLPDNQKTAGTPAATSTN